MRILFLARAYSNFSLRRMQQQLNIADVRKLLHTKDVKGDSIIGYSDRWPFVPYLSKLIPYDLIPFQVECTQFSLIDFPYSHMLVYTVGDIVIHLWIIIYPMMIDRYKSPENSIVYDVKQRKRTMQMVFSVFQQCLD